MLVAPAPGGPVGVPAAPAAPAPATATGSPTAFCGRCVDEAGVAFSARWTGNPAAIIAVSARWDGEPAALAAALPALGRTSPSCAAVRGACTRRGHTFRGAGRAREAGGAPRLAEDVGLVSLGPAQPAHPPSPLAPALRALAERLQRGPAAERGQASPRGAREPRARGKRATKGPGRSGRGLGRSTPPPRPATAPRSPRLLPLSCACARVAAVMYASISNLLYQIL